MVKRAEEIEAANRQVAKGALEIACAGRDADAIPLHWDESFIDHVNGTCVPRSRSRSPRVIGSPSRRKLHGTHRGRSVEIWGIVISRLRDGKIVEDWAASDTLELAKQLGVRRSLRLVVRHWRLLRG